jgi:hypothetical protein
MNLKTTKNELSLVQGTIIYSIGMTFKERTTPLEDPTLQGVSPPKGGPTHQGVSLPQNSSFIKQGSTIRKGLKPQGE